jgi:hypothetical protein
MENNKKEREKEKVKKAQQDEKEETVVLTIDTTRDESRLKIPANQPAYNKENNSNYSLITFLTSKHKPDIYFGKDVIKARSYKIKTTETKSNEEESDSHVDENFDELRKKDIRYFDSNNITIKCFNCGGIGHMARNCPNEVQKQCTRCNEQGHDEFSCPNTKCFKCNRVGHKSYECKARKDIEKCNNCKNVGHLSEDCLSKPNRITLKDLKENKITTCRFCGIKGHLICPFPKSPFIVDDYVSDHVVFSEDEEEGYVDEPLANFTSVNSSTNNIKLNTFAEIMEHRKKEKESGKNTPSSSALKKKKNYSSVVFCPNCAERHSHKKCTLTGRTNEFDQKRQIHSRIMFRNENNNYNSRK